MTITLAGILLSILITIPIVFFTYLYIYDKKQTQHSVLRNYPILGLVRYFLEKLRPELAQYLLDGDDQGKPFSRIDFFNVVLPAKYRDYVLSWGSKRDFDKAGFFVKNAMIPKLVNQLNVDNKKIVVGQRYKIKHEGLFTRKEKIVKDKDKPWLLNEPIVIGVNCEKPWNVYSPVGMSGMSFGALGDHAITALSNGIGMAHSWMNTGEGGLSKYHLSGNCDIILQIGPGINGARDKDGNFSMEELKKRTSNEQVKAIEIKLGQGAKIKGGMVPAEKVTPEIAEIRNVEPYKAINSPNRFEAFDDVPSMMDFIDNIRTETGLPVGIKIVIGGKDTVNELAQFMKDTGRGPDFIAVDGGEGGSGSAPPSMADSMGLPIKTALVILNRTLIRYGVRDRVKIIASGKLFSADKIAIALSMGADMVSMARSMMIAVGCIGAMRCANNDCPVGVATTDPKLQNALVVDEKQYRVTNYLLYVRKNLFLLTAAAGLTCPTQFTEGNIVYKDEKGAIMSLSQIHKDYY